MGLGNFRISWWKKATVVVGAVLEFIGVLPRERCRRCSARVRQSTFECSRCGCHFPAEKGDEPEEDDYA
jgi:Zn finger protein HypA/HybF involved in hydrogenase expression